MENGMIDYESRDEKGHWRPPAYEYAPLFRRPWKPLDVLTWLFGWGGSLWPRHLSYALLAYVTWSFLQVDTAQGTAPSPLWTGLMLIRNYALFIGFFLLIPLWR